MQKLPSMKRILSKTKSYKSLTQLMAKRNPQQPVLSILHFNDVYDIQSKNGSRGICNFKAQLQQLKQSHPDALVLFSGDCLSPSTLTNIKDGWQMVHALNTLKIDMACFGNHQFDFQSAHTLKLAKACNFPWLLGNITFEMSGTLLGDGEPYLVKDVKGIRVGVMGVAGADWIGILNEEYDNTLAYEDCYEFANRTAKYLREALRCDLVIALTHMRNGADRDFPNKVQGVDLVLGGHDHVIMQEFINRVPVIKSGSNFNNAGLINIYLPSHETPYKGKLANFDWKIYNVPIYQKVDLELKIYVDGLMQEYAKFDDVIGYAECDIQTRFVKIRTQETNYGNFLADLVRKYYDADVAVINSGMVRNDLVMKPGRLTYSKVSNIIDSPMVVKKVKGKALKQALQLSVSFYPDFSGQFLFVSGVKFSFDPKKTPRVQEVEVAGKELKEDRQYTLCTTYFQSRGGDGFQMLKEGDMIIDEVRGTSMLSLLLKFFKAPDTHQQFESIKLLSEEQVIKQDEELPEFPVHHLKLFRKVSVRMGRIKDLRSGFVLNDDGRKLTCINPQIDNRIKNLNPVQELPPK